MLDVASIDLKASPFPNICWGLPNCDFSATSFHNTRKSTDLFRRYLADPFCTKIRFFVLILGPSTVDSWQVVTKDLPLLRIPPHQQITRYLPKVTIAVPQHHFTIVCEVWQQSHNITLPYSLWSLTAARLRRLFAFHQWNRYSVSRSKKDFIKSSMIRLGVLSFHIILLSYCNASCAVEICMLAEGIYSSDMIMQARSTRSTYMILSASEWENTGGGESYKMHSEAFITTDIE